MSSSGTAVTRRILPDALARRARAFVAAGSVVVPAVAASTVVLLRDGAAGLEVYVHRRHTGMVFAGGMLAFPGGRVDPVDLAATDDLPAWVRQLDVDAQAASGFVRAAVRETHEETGVVLEPDHLVPWARWVTPRFEQRRYDTWFFLAGLPEGQVPEDVSGEVEDVAWLSPADAVDRADRGELAMLPPTRTVLAELALCTSVASALAAGDGRVVETVLPGWLDDGDDVWVLLPTDDDYPGDDPGEPT